uniref:MoaB/Mog domain-containing protein n=1 Tax=Caenorhabditis japonica TaxID=281687 RepID=A0A8R1DMN0_CAEJA
MTSIVNRPRESPWRAVSMEEADESIRKVAELFEKEIETILVDDLKIGQVLAEQVTAPENMPATRTSIKDGYAVISADGHENRKVVGASSAGSVHGNAIHSGECIRISTGGVVPDGTDAVIQVEDTEIEKSEGENELEIRVKSLIRAGQDIRQPGSEVKKGDVLLGVGCVLGSAEYGLLNAFGIEKVKIYKKPQITVISSGNELVSPFTKPLPLGMVRDSNSPQLVALFKEHGFKAINGGRIADEPTEIEKKLKKCAETTQIIVTSGGVSMGEKDYMKHVLQEKIGMKIAFGRVWMKPGLPCTMAHGLIHGKPVVVIALPGNPASAWVCSHLFVLPLLRAISGVSRIYAQKIHVKLGAALKLGPRPEYCRAWLEHSEDERLPIAHVTGNQISSRLASLVGAQVLLVLPSNEQKKNLEIGENVFALAITPNFSV